MSFAEVEKIIIVQLGELGLKLHKGFESLKNEKGVFYSATMFLIRQILPSSESGDLDNRLAQGSGAWKKQVEQCKKLVELVQRMGFRDELKFDNFLFSSNEEVVRNVLSFLIEQVQRKNEREERDDVEVQSVDNVEQQIFNRTTEIYNESYTVNWSKKKINQSPIVSNMVFVPSVLKTNVTIQNKTKPDIAVTVFEDNLKSLTHFLHYETEWKNYGVNSGLSRNDYFKSKNRRIYHRVKRIIELCKNTTDEDSILSSQKGSKRELFRGKYAKKFDLEADDDLDLAMRNVGKNSEEAAMDRQQEIERLDNELSKYMGAMNKVDGNMLKIKSTIGPFNDRRMKEKELSEKLLEEYRIVEQTCQLYDNKDENLRKLKKISSQSASKLLKLATEWEKYRQPKIDKIRELKKEILSFKERYKLETEKIEEKKAEMRKMIEEIKQKQLNYKKLVEFYNSLPKDKDRKFYVQKILDIVKNISNQNASIQKILFENRDVKDKTMTASMKSKNIYRELEEKVFSHAKEKNDKLSSELYKFLLEIHNDFDEMIKSVNQEVTHLCKIRDLEADIERMGTRKDADNMKKVNKELKVIVDENNGLLNKLQRLKDKTKR